jgi:hypothetical protein
MEMYGSMLRSSRALAYIAGLLQLDVEADMALPARRTTAVALKDCQQASSWPLLDEDEGTYPCCTKIVTRCRR